MDFPLKSTSPMSMAFGVLGAAERWEVELLYEIALHNNYCLDYDDVMHNVLTHPKFSATHFM